jgi:hypothetical protein
MCPSCESTLLVHSTPSIVLPCPLPPTLHFQQLSIHILVSSTFTDVMFYNTVDTITLFSFPPSPSSTQQFHCHRHVLHLSLYVIMFVFVCMFIFGSIFHIWEKICDVCLSEPGLLHLTWCPPIASIYLHTPCHYSLWLSKTPLRIYITFSWSIHQL